jgi:hypothetical protein
MMPKLHHRCKFRRYMIVQKLVKILCRGVERCTAVQVTNQIESVRYMPH